MRNQAVLVLALALALSLSLLYTKEQNERFALLKRAKEPFALFLSKTSNSHEKTKERIPNPAFISIVHLKKIIITLLTVSVHLKKFLWYTLYSPIDLI